MPGVPYTYLLKTCLYKIAICAFDTYDDLLTLFAAALGRATSTSHADYRALQFSHWSDKEIVEQFEFVQGSGYEECRARRISYDAVVKISVDDPDDPEIAHINLVRANTSIPTPSVRRTFKRGEYRWIIMEYIEGQRLDRCWHWLSYWTRLRVAFTLRRYIKQLRKIRSEHSTVPGPVATTPRYCKGLLFEDHNAGPFETPKLLSRWLRSMHGAGRVGEDTPISFDESKPLVFTHNNIRAENIIMGHDGRIWLINWDFSGFYPEWFEYATMDRAADLDQAPGPWRLLVPFIADPYMSLADYVRNIGRHIKTEDHWMMHNKAL